VGRETISARRADGAKGLDPLEETVRLDPWRAPTRAPATASRSLPISDGPPSSRRP
jgi:hypothetical protein